MAQTRANVIAAPGAKCKVAFLPRRAHLLRSQISMIRVTPISPRTLAGQIVLALIFLASSLAAAPAPAFQPLFNGRDLTGWTAPAAGSFWRAENGVLIGQSDKAQTGSTLRTEKNYGDFILELDARWSPEADSGVMVRKPSLQMQIGRSISQKRDFTGSFYLGRAGYAEVAQAKDAAKYLKPGDWNTLRLQAKGSTFTVWINGQQVVEYVDATHPEPGPIGVQIHAKLDMKVEFRNVRIAELR